MRRVRKGETRRSLPMPNLGRSLSTCSTSRRGERAENRNGREQLQVCREAPRAVPAAAVEELPPARAQEREDVLEIRRGARRGAEGRRVERTAARGEEQEAREPASDLEAPRADVLVRQAVTHKVENRS